MINISQSEEIFTKISGILEEHCHNEEYKRTTYAQCAEGEDTLYLARRKVVGRGFISGYAGKLPQRLPDDVMLLKIKQLRTGDDSVRDEIILQYMHLAIHIVTKYVTYFPQKYDDLMSVATVSLVTAVSRFHGIAKDDNLGAYIRTCLHGEIARFIQQEDHTIQITTRGFEKAVKKASDDKISVASCLPQTKSIESNSNNSEVSKDNLLFLSPNLSTTDDNTDVEINEILLKCNFTRFEMLVYERLIQGMDGADIARELGYSKQRISQIKKDVFEKLTPYYGETND